MRYLRCDFNAGIDFLEFRPSEIAAAVAIAVVGEIKTVDAEQAIPVLSQHVEKVKLVPLWSITSEEIINDDFLLLVIIL